MISVAEALDHVFSLVAPLPSETVALRDALGRVLAATLNARLTQPPFPSAAMDGFAIAGDTAAPGATYRVVGESAAGHGFGGTVGAGDCVRIFTGAPLPDGTDRVIIQEDVARDGDRITLGDRLDTGHHVRAAGQDFRQGDAFQPRGALRPVDLALIAAMGHGQVTVTRRPEVAIIATGDELVAPGETPGPDQIVASNNLGLAAMIDRAGGRARLLPIARDTTASLDTAFELARGADMVVTIGGASVGDHDLVAQVAEGRGLERSFYKVAMRPGKPLMAGRLDGAPMLGLPGNPVSALVCGQVFVLPALRVLMGLPAAPAPRQTVPLGTDLPANGPREHYMRASLQDGRAHVADRQDSALLSVLAGADALVIRPPDDPPRGAGDTVEIIAL
ncbi:molybdopterin molybdotransferase [Palleronia salina]|uniref:Molybdopterin molybdenumtransferase n=1 Tax=Palleronia salina TaxID=313368 RepID=A0A1M6ABZ1_9RHOB|nr:gephyrin-like molybdotransferase Glp [Palleronia salina]SHI34006.1 molybdopterin molybdotransferase [Palleronia salina]